MDFIILFSISATNNTRYQNIAYVLLKVTLSFKPLQILIFKSNGRQFKQPPQYNPLQW